MTSSTKFDVIQCSGLPRFVARDAPREIQRHGSTRESPGADSALGPSPQARMQIQLLWAHFRAKFRFVELSHLMETTSPDTPKTQMAPVVAWKSGGQGDPQRALASYLGLRLVASQTCMTEWLHRFPSAEMAVLARILTRIDEVGTALRGARIRDPWPQTAAAGSGLTKGDSGSSAGGGVKTGRSRSGASVAARIDRSAGNHFPASPLHRTPAHFHNLHPARPGGRRNSPSVPTLRYTLGRTRSGSCRSPP